MTGETLQTRLLEAESSAQKVILELKKEITSGMTEADIAQKALTIMAKLGAKKNWHKPVVRIDENTTLSFSEPAKNPDIQSTSESIVMLDFGPVFKGYEADVAETICLSGRPEHLRIIRASEQIWEETTKFWKEEGSETTGKKIYEFASYLAEKADYDLITTEGGHRIGEFPHERTTPKKLCDLEIYPEPFEWILEIKLCHKSEPFGAFYERILH